MSKKLLEKVSSKLAELEDMVERNSLCTKDGIPIMIMPQTLAQRLKELREEIDEKIRGWGGGA